MESKASAKMFASYRSLEFQRQQQSYTRRIRVRTLRSNAQLKRSTGGIYFAAVVAERAGEMNFKWHDSALIRHLAGASVTFAVARGRGRDFIAAHPANNGSAVLRARWLILARLGLSEPISLAACARHARRMPGGRGPFSRHAKECRLMLSPVTHVRAHARARSRVIQSAHTWPTAREGDRSLLQHTRAANRGGVVVTKVGSGARSPRGSFPKGYKLPVPRQFQPIYYSCRFDVCLAASCCDTGNQSKTLVGGTEWPAVGATSREPR